MTSTIAFIGKSGSGKTTLSRAFLKLIRKNFPDSSILMVDNDLTLELSESFGIKTKNTIYGIKSGKHEYKTGIPEGMSKQEYIEWALEDIIVEIDENVDMIASWFVTPKDCNCPSTKLMRDSLSKLVSRYDFVIFDCEYDLKYLNSLIDYPVDEAVIVSSCDKQNIALSAKIAETSQKYVYDGQLGILLNKVEKEKLSAATELLNSFELYLLGYLQEYENINCDEMINILEIIYSRMNLPQIEG
ncbi:MAG: AAA family ATPase [Candidatus Gastranaerophilales bacterium]|nr:AAA family ATPase [Candidatus Gastranaerophilales bacterium]